MTEFRPISLCNVIYRIVAKTIANKLIQGIKFGSSLSITHLLFVDDSLIFTRAKTEECIRLKQIFYKYAVASGQIFNFGKSSMLFSRNKQAKQIEEIKSIFQLNVVSRHEKYLGLPSMVRRKKVSFFNYIKLRVLNKISSWQSKWFSSGGKEVLIKAIVQAVPSYAVSIFKIPLGLYADIQGAIARFWWHSKGNHRGIHWAKWEKMCNSKGRWGMGFRDLSSFNQALIAKQGWRVIQFPDSLMAKVLQAQYFKQTGFRNAKLGYNPSFI